MNFYGILVSVEHSNNVSKFYNIYLIYSLVIYKFLDAKFKTYDCSDIYFIIYRISCDDPCFCISFDKSSIVEH